MAARGLPQIDFYIAALARVYGVKRIPPRRARPPALDELVLTILSQNTNDLNRDRAWNSLRQRFPGWEDVLKAKRREVVAAIRVGGLAEQKAGRIQAALRRIKKEEGAFSLERLCGLPLEEARDYLLSFKGVGDKTAAVVLLFSCGLPAFPADTHVLRVSRRLGLIAEKTTAHEAHERLGRLVPKNKMYEFHLNLIVHGRAVCRAAKPDCPRCCLTSRCRYFLRSTAGSQLMLLPRERGRERERIKKNTDFTNSQEGFKKDSEKKKGKGEKIPFKRKVAAGLQCLKPKP